MPMTASSPAARAAWLEKHALPKARKVKDSTLTSVQMCEIVGVVWTTLRKWTRDIAGFEASGAFVRGDRGMEYEFKPLATVNFLIAHFKAEAEQRAAAAKQVREAIGGNALADVPTDMSLDDIRKAIQVRAEMIRQEEREGRLVEREIVEKAIDAMISQMTEAGVRATREQDPTGQFPPEIAEKFENAVESIMVSIQSAGARCLNELRSGGSVT